MAEYQNIFTRVQVRGPAYAGVPLTTTGWTRTGKPFFDHGGAVNAGSSGSGDISVADVRGPLTVRIAGSGDVKVNGGEASEVDVSIAGSGGVRFGGLARSLKASIAGSGDVSVAEVQGPITKHIFGSGEVRVGR